MPVDSIAPPRTSINAGDPTTIRAPKQTMDGEMFLSLLVTQLRYQDPSSPMDSGAMIQQTAQLASMEQLTSLNDVSQDSYALQQRIAAASIIGQQVSYVGSDGTTVTGTATSVSFAGGSPTVKVGDVVVPLADLTAFAQAVPAPAAPPASPTPTA
jgi:flagellar basal-body rod modification protein FlgD